MADPKGIAEKAQKLATKGFAHQFGKPAIKLRQCSVWHQFKKVNTRLWLDTCDLERASRLWCDQFHAITTDSRMLNEEIQKGTYDELIFDAAQSFLKSEPKISDRTLLLEIAFVLYARHALKLVHRLDAFVNVDIHFAFDDNIDIMVYYGKRLYEICPQRFIVKLPFTPAGILAVRQLSRQGIPVNLTVGFSARQAFLAARVAKPRYANVFVGRLNSFVRDNRLGEGINFGEKAVLSAQRELLKLRSSTRSQTRLIAASIRSPRQIQQLAGIDVETINPGVIGDYEKEPPSRLLSHVYDDLPVELSPSTSMEAINAATLYEIPQEFRIAVNSLMKKDLNRITPADVVEHLAENGFADLFPQYSEDDQLAVIQEGKIPKYSRWKARLESGEMGLDALMSYAALNGFIGNQSELDDRIISLLHQTVG